MQTEETLLRLFKASGATTAEMDEAERDIRRWGRGSTFIEVNETGRRLLRILPQACPVLYSWHHAWAHAMPGSIPGGMVVKNGLHDGQDVKAGSGDSPGTRHLTSSPQACAAVGNVIEESTGRRNS
jgi:hypothetical protein